MFENIDNLKLLGIIHGISALYQIYTNRPSHVFIFKIDGESKYTFNDKIIHLSQGEMLFISKGSSYTVELVSGNNSRYILINFEADVLDAQPKKYQLSNLTDFNHICSRLLEYTLLDADSDRYKCLSLFYEILSYISSVKEPEYKSADTLSLIEPAVEFIKENIFDPTMKIGDLHSLCGISDTYFRKLFILRFGISPKKYVLNKRIIQAKTIIDNGEFNSIREVALLTGFADALYFSKVFKHKYGYPPSENDRKQ